MKKTVVFFYSKKYGEISTNDDYLQAYYIKDLPIIPIVGDIVNFKLDSTYEECKFEAVGINFVVTKRTLYPSDDRANIVFEVEPT